MFDLLVKIFLTPENIIGLLFNLSGILALCFIFKEWNEKWWKSLIPIYSTYILYKHLWKYKWLCIIQFVFSFINTKCLSIFRKHIIGGILSAITNYINTKSLNIDIKFSLLLICILGFILSYIVVFIFKRITYYRINKQFHNNVLIQIGTFLLPDVFLLISYINYKKKQKKEVTL